MDRVPLRVHLGLYDDETAERCHWHVPQAHALEAWGDARAYDGTVTIQQPLIAPLYPGCKSPHEMLAAFSARPSVHGHDVVRDYWRANGALGADFERGWRRALHDGFVAGSALPAIALAASGGDDVRARARVPAPAGMEIAFRPDPTIGDGRFANNGWLQELPKPLTKLTWDNAAHMSPATARRLGISIERTARGATTDVVELRYRGRTRPGAGVDHARPSRRHRDRPLRLRPAADGTRGQQHRLRRLRAAHQRRAVVRPRAGGGQDRRALHPGLHPGPLEHGAPRPGPRANAGASTARPPTTRARRCTSRRAR